MSTDSGDFYTGDVCHQLRVLTAAAEPHAVAPDASVADDLDDLLDALEAVDWHQTPGIGTDTAAGFARRIREARDEIRPCEVNDE